MWELHDYGKENRFNLSFHFWKAWSNWPMFIFNFSSMLEIHTGYGSHCKVIWTALPYNAVSCTATLVIMVPTFLSGSFSEFILFILYCFVGDLDATYVMKRTRCALFPGNQLLRVTGTLFLQLCDCHKTKIDPTISILFLCCIWAFSFLVLSALTEKMFDENRQINFLHHFFVAFSTLLWSSCLPTFIMKHLRYQL